MRRIVALALVAALVPVASASHATYVDETKVVGCLALVRAGGVTAGLNCGVTKAVGAAESAGRYQLTVEWQAGGDFAQLQAELLSCAGPCVQSGVCVNNVCQGGGNNIVQQASGLGGSPLVLSISAAGAEDTVQFRVMPPGPAFASLGSVQVRYVLEHLG